MALKPKSNSIFPQATVAVHCTMPSIIMYHIPGKTYTLVNNYFTNS